MSPKRRITPASVLVGSALVIIFFVLLMPRPDAENAPALDSRSMGVTGAGGLYRTLSRLGYKVSRNTERFDTALPANATYVLLAPRFRVTAEEAAALTSAARRGATVVFTPSGGALTDSLGFRIGGDMTELHSVDRTSVIGGPVPPNPTPYLPVPLTESVQIADSTHTVHGLAFMWFVPHATSDDSSVAGARNDTTHPGDTTARLIVHVLGRRFGAGHAIAIAPADIAANAALRSGPPAVAIVRALEWADAESGTRRPVIFDEYHHGAGHHADPIGTTVDALTGTPPGRATLMAIAAALVLLLAVGSRPIAPLPVATVQRRSPLEHVRALARAYLQSGADRLGAERLVRGLRRRHPLGLPRNVSDRIYLETIGARHPDRTGDVAVVVAALDHGASTTGRMTGTRDAVARIEQTLQTALSTS